MVSALQSELVGVKAHVTRRSMRDRLAGGDDRQPGAREQLLKRRLYGNKTERSHTSELQLALGDLLATEARLQKELDDGRGQGARGRRRRRAAGRRRSGKPSRRAGAICSRATCRASWSRSATRSWSKRCRASASRTAAS